MSETPSLEWIGRTLLTIQADMRALREENALTQERCEELLGVLRSMSDALLLSSDMRQLSSDALQGLTNLLQGLNERLERLEALPRSAGPA